MNDNFSRYQKQIGVNEFGEGAQIKLELSSVWIIGLGGLGLHAAKLLAGSGVGDLVLVDHDSVDETNLHRQFYDEYNVGDRKANAAFEIIFKLNSHVRLHSFCEKFESFLSKKLTVSKPNLILDCTDNTSSRKAIYEYGKVSNTTVISAGVGIYKGQVVQYNSSTPFMGGDKDPELHAALGPVCSTISSIQAMMALNYLVGIDSEYNYIQLNVKSFCIDKMRI